MLSVVGLLDQTVKREKRVSHPKMKGKKKNPKRKNKPQRGTDQKNHLVGDSGARTTK